MRKRLAFLLLPVSCGGVSDVPGALRALPGSQLGGGGVPDGSGGRTGGTGGNPSVAGPSIGGSPVASGSGGFRSGTPLVLGANEKPYGLTHEEWLARFWQWFLALPKANHPREGGDCSQGQQGGVWFLTTGHNGVVETRECTIPAGTALFIPATSELLFPRPDCSSSCSGATPEAWKDGLTGRLANSLEDLAEDRVTVELDGELLPVGIDYLWETSGEFFVQAPAQDAYFSCIGPIGDTQPSGPDLCDWRRGSARPFASAGFAAMLPPLPVGTHVLRLGARAFSWSWQTDVTYVLEVIP